MGKKYLEIAKLVDSKKIYSISEAVSLVKKTSITKFDASVDLAVKLAVDPAHSDQNIRGSFSLPHGNGKTARVLVICNPDEVELSKSAGADFAGHNEVIEKIKDGWIDFDVVITTPEVMPMLSKVSKILGPKGLMPNLKLGTVTKELAKTVNEYKKGKLDYRVDKQGNVHLSIGKVSFPEDKLSDNILAMVEVLRTKRPPSVKGTYISNISISTTMGPGIKVEIPLA